MPTPPTAALSVRDGYAAWASLYDDDGNPLIALEGPAVRDWFGPLDGRRVLDVGCGTGRHTEALLDAGARRVVALDVTPAMIARARAKLVGRPVDWLLHALPAPLPFDDETFDLAVLGLVAEHIARGLNRPWRRWRAFSFREAVASSRPCIPSALPRASVLATSTPSRAFAVRSRPTTARLPNTTPPPARPG